MLQGLAKFTILVEENQIVARFWKPLKSAKKVFREKTIFEYVDDHRIGDHICYYSDLTKIRKHYPKFQLINSLGDTIQQIVKAQNSRK